MDEHRNSTEQRDDEGKAGPRRQRIPFLFLILLGMLILLIILLGKVKQGNIEHPKLAEFFELLDAGKIAKATLEGQRLEGQLKPDSDAEPARQFSVTFPQNLLLEEKRQIEVTGPGGKETKRTVTLLTFIAMTVGKENFTFKKSSNLLYNVFLPLLPWIILIAFFYFFFIKQMRAAGAGGGVLSFGRSRARLYGKDKIKITFDDVAGIDEAREEVAEIVEFLKNPGRFQKIGGRIPRGVLLIGPPGCGKTLLAKAIAGEASVPFFSICGSDFVEMFVGVGASRVRDLFKQAREKAPCIVFLDEIDAMGRRRGAGLGGGHDEREQTLNAILVEMDGFETEQGVIVIAATNRPDVLDPALSRPGRFDRQIVIDLPDQKGRLQILKIHARRVKLSPEVDLELVARGTPGFSGADLEAVINEAALLAAGSRKDAVDQRDIEDSRDKIRFGRAKRSRIMDEEDRMVVAYHEAGHALLACVLPETEPLHKVSIIPRGMALGMTMQLPTKDRYHLQRKKLLGDIQVLYGGRIAEERFLGDVSAGAQNDIERATELARRMVCEWGMSEGLGPVNYGANADTVFLGREITRTQEHSEETAQRIDAEINRITRECYQAAELTITERGDQVETIARALLALETLEGEEVEQLVAGRSVEDVAAARKAAETRPAARPSPAPRLEAQPEGRPVPDKLAEGTEPAY